MHGWRAWAGVGAVVLGGVLAPRPASACDPIHGPSDVLPQSGALASNGRILVLGLGLKLDGFDALVDGQPVELQSVAQLGGSDAASMYGAMGLRLTEPADEGATLELRYTGGEWNDEIVAVWTIGPADDTAPAVAGSVHFDLHDLPTECGSNTCKPHDPELGYWVHVESLQADEGSPVVAVVRGHRVDPPAEDRLFRVLRPGDGPIAFFVDDDADSLGTEPPHSAYCFEVRVFDLAGHEAAWGHETCLPCHFRVDTEPEFCVFDGKGPEPAWTDADLWGGGICEGAMIEPAPEPEPEPEPEPGDETGGDETTGDDGGETTGMGGTGTTDATTMGGGDSSDEGTPAPGSTSDGTDAGASDTTERPGCGCAADTDTSPATLAWLALAGWLRRRRAVLSHV